MVTPEDIQELKENEIFVFGSNLAGKHIGGAAQLAYDKFGAEIGVGEGLKGRCYAFPTLGKELEQRDHEDLKESAAMLFKTCLDYPEKTFLLTKVGIGIANYDISEIAPLFRNAPNNIIQPKQFLDYNHRVR